MICPGMTSSQTCEQCTARGRNCESLHCTPPWETKRCWRVSHGQPGSGEWNGLREEGHQRAPGKCPRRENHHLDLRHTESDKDPGEKRGPCVFSAERIQARFRWNYWQQKQSFRLHETWQIVTWMKWTWIWANSGRLWRTGKPGMLLSVGSQSIRHSLMSEHSSVY